MDPRGWGAFQQLLQNLIAAPFRAAGELFGLFSKSQTSVLTPELLAARSNRRRGLMAGLPACMAFFIAMGVVAWGASNRNRIANQYIEKLSVAISDTNAQLADRIGRRVFEPGVRNIPSAAMDYCSFLASQKDLFQANRIIEKIASDDTPGYPPAHAQRAVAYSNLLSQGAGDRYLPILLWHLKQAGDPASESMWMAWANYYRLSGQIDRTVLALESAAFFNPVHWFSVADLYMLDGNTEQAKRALASASNTFRSRLSKDPLSIQDRLQLAIAQARNGEFQQAAQTIKTGLELEPGNSDLTSANAQLEMMRLDQSLKQAAKVTQKLAIAKEMVNRSDDPSGPYQATVEIYQQASSLEDKNLVADFLQECLVEKGSNASLMFSQSVILLDQGKLAEARKKLQDAVEEFPDHGLSLNNLAWLLATQNPMDLEQAKRFAQRAVATNPAIATFHDTLGTIHIALEDWRSAIAELELALAQTPVNARSKIHAKLATAYESIGDPTLANLHRQRGAIAP